MDTSFDVAQYVAQHTAALPGLLAFSMAARTSLKSYVASQATEAPPKVSDKDLKKMTWARRVGLVVGMVAVFGTEIWLLSTGDEHVLDMFFRYLFAFVYQLALMGTLVDLNKSFKWAAFRSPGNLLAFRPAPGSVSFPRVLTAVTIATGINVATYFDLHYGFASFLSVALLYRTLSGAHGRTFSLRVTMICLLAWLAVTFVAVAFIVVYAATYLMDGAAGSPILEGLDDGPDGPPAFASPVVMRYLSLMTPFIYAFAPGMLITGCFRFDWANHVADAPEVAQAVTLETCEPRKRFAKYLSQGVILPATMSTAFPKPYYTTALWAWILAQVAVVGLWIAALPLPREVLEAGTFDMMALSLAIPFMVVALAVTASLRGEFRSLWTYKEVWARPESDTGGAIVLGEGSTLDAEAHVDSALVDEKRSPLAAVEPVVVVVEAAPAYAVEAVAPK
ncbi:uncharacterized protein RHOBADRAFT_66643 [Rhodotorula graminis WP1]|uniref:Uncharacterized protein n=1 Tax=Rhodotorula graminis (strain WP1) TaxID=578459 RepID=A0A194S1K9_RHOGW|nr:uncharacterized protein RHOBADRAFT_66643 [Rhodotorula graminis WP1]KPV74404.1 hypothetical protein RHOBADRAFT_66643 [Rhodotorula graminis WP1]